MELSEVYVKTDSYGRIIQCDGGYTTPQNLNEWIKIDEGFGDKYNLCQSHYFENGIYTEDGIPIYKLVNGNPVERTDDEIYNDRVELQDVPPTETEQLRADVDFIAAMIGVSL